LWPWRSKVKVTKGHNAQNVIFAISQKQLIVLTRNQNQIVAELKGYISYIELFVVALPVLKHVWGKKNESENSKSYLRQFPRYLNCKSRFGFLMPKLWGKVVLHIIVALLVKISIFAQLTGGHLGVMQIKNCEELPKWQPSWKWFRTLYVNAN